MAICFTVDATACYFDERLEREGQLHDPRFCMTEEDIQACAIKDHIQEGNRTRPERDVGWHWSCKQWRSSDAYKA